LQCGHDPIMLGLATGVASLITMKDKDFWNGSGRGPQTWNPSIEDKKNYP